MNSLIIYALEWRTDTFGEPCAPEVNLSAMFSSLDEAINKAMEYISYEDCPVIIQYDVATHTVLAEYEDIVGLYKSRQVLATKYH